MKKAIFIVILITLLYGCCNPNKPVAMIYHTFKTYEDGFNIVKGYDCDCDSDIDYWQHYDGDEPFGPKIYTKGKEGKCEKK